MTIKDIIYNSAVLLNDTEIADYLNAKKKDVTAKQTVSRINAYVTLANTIIGELAGSYLKMIAVENVNAVDGKIYFSSLSKPPLKIVCVKDIDGAKLDLAFHSEYVKAYGSGRVIEYEYVPKIYDLDEEIGYGEKDVPLSILTFGLISEICLYESRFSEAIAWRKRFTDSLSNHVVPKNAKIKGRCWL